MTAETKAQLIDAAKAMDAIINSAEKGDAISQKTVREWVATLSLQAPMPIVCPIARVFTGWAMSAAE